MASTDKSLATAQVVMTTDSNSHTVKTEDTPIRLRAPMGAESALKLDPNTEYAVLLVPVPYGYRAVTEAEMESCKKPTQDVMFWSTKSVQGGAWKRIKDKEDITWHVGAQYVVPIDCVLEPNRPDVCIMIGDVEVPLTDEQVDSIIAELSLS